MTCTDHTLTFEPLDHYSPGILEEMQIESFASLQASDSIRAHWRKVDRLAFDNLDTVGCNMFITCLATIPIGFAAFDPRPAPAYAVIGQNCILPHHRGNGYGTQQIREILRRMRERGIRKAVVTTGQQGFFIPAQRMYQTCGFTETRRFVMEQDQFPCIQYEREL
jgi:GNAT superfamily N-acetyltransferase